jgi:hypothetical protein
VFLFRALYWLILAILVITVLRGVLGFLARMFFNAAAGPGRPQGAPQKAPGKSDPLKPESLKKDPVCGTFVAPSSALQKERDGQTYFFCSKECLDRF